MLTYSEIMSNKPCTLVVNHTEESYSLTVSSQFATEFALFDNSRHELFVEDKLPVTRLEHALEAYYANMATLLSSCYADLALVFERMSPRDVQKYAYLFGLRERIDIKKVHVANYIGEMLEKEQHYKRPYLRALPYFFDRIERSEKIRRVVSAIMWYHDTEDLTVIRWESYQDVLKLATSVESRGCILASDSVTAPLTKSVTLPGMTESTLEKVLLICFKHYVSVLRTVLETVSVDDAVRMFKELLTPVHEPLQDNVASCAKYYVKRLIVDKTGAGYSCSIEDVVTIVREHADHSCKMMLHNLLYSIAVSCDELDFLVADGF